MAHRAPSDIVSRNIMFNTVLVHTLVDPGLWICSSILQSSAQQHEWHECMLFACVMAMDLPILAGSI